MSKFIHNGIEISLNESTGKFSAAINGEVVVSTSLTGIKKKIDAPKEFEPFVALVKRYGEVREVTIVRKKKERARRHGNPSMLWVDDKNNEYYSVIPNTQEARDAIKWCEELRKKNRAEIDRLNEEISDADGAIPSLKPD